MEFVRGYNNAYFNFVTNQCKELGVPEELYLNWREQQKNDWDNFYIREIQGKVIFEEHGVHLPFYLQKYESGSLETGVIAFKLFPDKKSHLILWEYRRFDYPEGNLHAIEGKRKFLEVNELQRYIDEGYHWTERLSPPIGINFSLAEEGKFTSSYEELK
ncbi:hypothetical protein ACTFSJ_24180 [Bacillus cereus group sp. MYBK12-2]|uniref:Uncharacterized protein n=1 Tax=Bacillus thuringiensis serovar sooncheon TaxID=180891 RepID=A0A9Q5SCY5_BACTU|nr:hypothetical protein [Bacillus thuringiensis]MEB9661522.1 hypothetical protein [Bacillus cereus]ARV91195.1 hypothetical protein BJG91_00510 [Bacillus thuringiensis]OTW68886.1 hypothetical protein BK707_17690 [Bacillus thuringiensis serovar coreanensis]OTX42618.1 hypothetical protein BK724_24945 [Bacillus thuringiensis serovar sooncheon]OTX54494.1 hypothetical protein BK725_12440 [Bacillus thuringiensis serovar guiyangiensis]